MKKPKKRKKAVAHKRQKAPLKPTAQADNPKHREAFDQLLDDAVLGAFTKK